MNAANSFLWWYRNDFIASDLQADLFSALESGQLYNFFIDQFDRNVLKDRL